MNIQRIKEMHISNVSLIFHKPIETKHVSSCVVLLELPVKSPNNNSFAFASWHLVKNEPAKWQGCHMTELSATDLSMP